MRLSDTPRLLGGEAYVPDIGISQSAWRGWDAAGGRGRRPSELAQVLEAATQVPQPARRPQPRRGSTADPARIGVSPIPR